MADADSFYLDTSNMNTIIGHTKRLAEEMETLKADLNIEMADVAVDWLGKGGTMFEKKYKLLLQQMKDMSQSIYDLSERLITSAEAYMQADVDMSKAMDGTTNRY